MGEESENKEVLLCAIWLEGDKWRFEALPFCPDDIIVDALEEFIKVIKEGKMKATLNVKVNGETVIRDELPEVKK